MSDERLRAAERAAAEGGVHERAVWLNLRGQMDDFVEIGGKENWYWEPRNRLRLAAYCGDGAAQLLVPDEQFSTCRGCGDDNYHVLEYPRKRAHLVFRPCEGPCVHKTGQVDDWAVAGEDFGYWTGSLALRFTNQVLVRAAHSVRELYSGDFVDQGVQRAPMAVISSVIRESDSTVRVREIICDALIRWVLR